MSSSLDVATSPRAQLIYAKKYFVPPYCRESKMITHWGGGYQCLTFPPKWPERMFTEHYEGEVATFR